MRRQVVDVLHARKRARRYLPAIRFIGMRASTPRCPRVPEADSGALPDASASLRMRTALYRGAATRGCSRRPQPAARRPGRSRRARALGIGQAPRAAGGPRPSRWNAWRNTSPTSATPSPRIDRWARGRRAAGARARGDSGPRGTGRGGRTPRRAGGAIDRVGRHRCRGLPRCRVRAPAREADRLVVLQSFEERQHRPTRGGPPLARNAGAAPVVGQKAWCGARFGAYERSYHSASLRCSVCTCPGGMRL